MINDTLIKEILRTTLNFRAGKILFYSPRHSDLIIGDVIKRLPSDIYFFNNQQAIDALENALEKAETFYIHVRATSARQSEAAGKRSTA